MLVLGVLGRILITRLAAGSAVDQHYWFLAAKAYREQRRLPVKIKDKFLLEDEAQAYPPLFGLLLARIAGSKMEVYLTPILGILEFFILFIFLFILDIPLGMIVLALGIYATAPVQVVYNTQLTPRILGDLFLFLVMMFQVLASVVWVSPEAQWISWVLSAFFVAMVVMSHKMTLQIYLVVLPFWWFVLGAWEVAAATLGGYVFYTAIVGIKFAKYQMRAHWDIVTFWNKNWPNLGAHQFNHSPLYGNPSMDRSLCFHAPGWNGAYKHLRTVVSYLPIIFILPICSYFSGIWPPSWTLVWFSVVCIWSLVTLLLPSFKCWGGGHLYVFNLVIPACVYIAYLPQTLEVGLYITLGCILTLISLVYAGNIVKKRPFAIDANFDRLISSINNIPKANFAVFPTQIAERVAQQTHHAVLWGGHGFGFNRLEGFWPVLTQPLSVFFRRYDVSWVLWDSEFWPQGKMQMSSEGLIHKSEVRGFERWCLAPIKTSNAQIDLSSEATVNIVT
jgi:hypothetical protein